MRRTLGLVAVSNFLFFLTGYSQVHVVFVLDSATARNFDTVYLAGNRNGWQPAALNAKFVQGELKMDVPAGEMLEFKLTRGSWNTVESSNSGTDVPNRFFHVFTDTIIHLTVAAWKDDFEPVPKKHTASINVSVIDSVFSIPQLNRKRTVRIYLPPDYKTGSKRYPVLYMSDGQNCFDELTGSYGEWQVDEALDHFYDSCKKSLIVVAIDHGGSHRLQEYDPYNFEGFGEGEGKAYAAFLANTLKPYIDHTFRTFKDKAHTHIAGSSMGGVISMWSMIAYPQVFGNAGIFSPAFWTAKEIYADAKRKLQALDGESIFLYAGGSESKEMVPDMETLATILKTNKKIKIKKIVDQPAQHNEAAWRKWFPVYLNFILK